MLEWAYPPLTLIKHFYTIITRKKITYIVIILLVINRYEQICFKLCRVWPGLFIQSTKIFTTQCIYIPSSPMTTNNDNYDNNGNILEQSICK